MMRASGLIESFFLVSLPLAASAEDAAFIDGIFASEAGCKSVAESGGTTPTEESGTVLTATGFAEIEWHCDFVRIDRHESTEAWVASMICEEPGFIYPDMVALRFQDEKTITASFLTDEMAVRSGGEPAFDKPFVRCEATE